MDGAKKNFGKKGPYLYERNKLLGKGSYGEVFSCFHETRPNEKLALKIIFIPSFSKKESILQKLTNAEIKTQFSAQHKNALKLYDVIREENLICLISEFCEKKLNEIIAKGDLTQNQAFDYFYQILCGMNYLNSQKIIHRDLKPQNILIKGNIVKIADFGFARFVDDPTKVCEKTFEVGTPLYLSPQIYYRKPYSSKCDVWSLGIILYQMLYRGECPWNTTKGLVDLFDNISKEPLVFPDKPAVKDEVKTLIKNMLELKEEDRFDFKQITDYFYLLDRDQRYYCNYLKNMAKFYSELNKNLKDQFNSDYQKINILLYKFETMCYYKMDEIARSQNGLEAFENMKSEYIKMYQNAKTCFRDFLQKNESKRSKYSENFNNLILSENFEYSEEFRVEYSNIMSEGLRKIAKDYENALNKMESQKLQTVFALIEVRSIRNLEKFYSYDDEKFDENPFENIHEMFHEMSKAEKFEKIKFAFKKNK